MYDYHVTMDSFGDTLPANWEAIADYLNRMIDEALAQAEGAFEDGFDGSGLSREGHEIVDGIWERYWRGEIEDAPEPVTATESKKWVLIENVGDIFETILQADSKEAAIEEARIKWRKMSAYDQKRRTEFFIVYAALDEDGIADLNTGMESINLLDLFG